MSMVETSSSEASENSTEVASSVVSLLFADGRNVNLENMNFFQLAQCRSRAKSNVAFIEKRALNRERQDATERAQQEQQICKLCKLVQDPRMRKVSEIRQVYLEVLSNKPADMFCSMGIFANLEIMACKGLLDSVVASGPRCVKCRQATDAVGSKALMTAEIAEILKYQVFKQETATQCSPEKACSHCLDYVITSLVKSTPGTSNTQHVTCLNLIPELENFTQQFEGMKALIEKKHTEILNVSNQQITNLKTELENKHTEILNVTNQQITNLKTEMENKHTEILNVTNQQVTNLKTEMENKHTEILNVSNQQMTDLKSENEKLKQEIEAIDAQKEKDKTYTMSRICAVENKILRSNNPYSQKYPPSKRTC